ncbi:cytochrome c oxidase assembly protein [Pseudoxanthobacter sp. M-2]|uniref:cytochrome c oxidase assembly protein n=1 Tax=Pseudoxanthobacter sp. M-2 TaxID=3078754 RepID=UPI0038FC217C
MEDVYCGPAPTPEQLLFAWNVDIVAIGVCMVLVVLHAATRAGGRLPLALGVGLLALLFLSPLCSLTVALFSARAVHHVLLVAVAAPLLVTAFGLHHVRSPLLSLGGLVALGTVAMWMWHAPSLYAAGISSGPLYWVMQASLLGSGVLFWQAVLSLHARPGPALLALLATIVQMGMLGALLTFATRPLYAAHATTTIPFGLSPLEDQQLAGLILWVPAALPYLVAMILIVLRLQPVADGARAQPVTGG